MHYRYLRFPGGKNKAVTFSYDDGCPADIRMADTLTQYGMKGTFNLNSVQRISVEEIRRHILDNGHEIAVHGAEHMAPGITPVLRGIQDVLNCRLYLEKMHGRIVRGMAYPDCGITHFENGVTYAQVKQYLTELGIVYARTLKQDNNSFALPEDWHAWVPTAHHNNPNIFAYADEFLDDSIPRKYEFPRLFYVWGHSYEFDNNNNWEHLNALCQKLSGREDVWYATNIEIYEYVTAWQSLVFSVDESIVYNPSLFTLWIYSGEKEYVIQPGETITI